MTNKTINKLRNILYYFLNLSLIKSNKRRKEFELKKRLISMNLDLTNQYSTMKIDMETPYFSNQIFGMHAFQTSLAMKAIDLLGKRDIVNVVDIGDSSGHHMLYLKEILKEEKYKLNTLSVNLDPIAIEKIKSKKLDAVLCRAEELHLHQDGMEADIFLSYEMLEHLINPIGFLHEMAEKSKCEYFAITIPYLAKSRVGMQQIRHSVKGDLTAERLHIFELSPEDWKYIFRFSGWKIEFEDVYKQYPTTFPFNLTKKLWRKYDFEGFYGVILSKDNIISDRYKDW